MSEYFKMGQEDRKAFDEAFGTETASGAHALTRSAGSRWKSCADWGDYEVCNGYQHNITDDTHATKEQAEAVCEMLETRGFGGRGQVFPAKTWTEEITSDNTED